jgi:hypothetical protein
MGWISNFFGGGGDDDDDDNTDYDSNGKFVPGPGFYNVSQEERPVVPVARDHSGDYWEDKDGTLINTRRVINEGDE